LSWTTGEDETSIATVHITATRELFQAVLGRFSTESLEVSVIGRHRIKPRCYPRVQFFERVRGIEMIFE